MQKEKLIGMVQSKKEGNDIYKVGCLGKISDLQKNDDGRILINLTGLTRFEILEEIKNAKLYREFKVTYQNFDLDLKPFLENVESETLMKKAKIFLKKST